MVDDPYKPRDPEVEKATSGGFRSILPNRITLLAVGGLSAVGLLAPDSPIGTVLNGPLVKQVERDQDLDDAGTPYGPTERTVPTAGLAVVVVYQIFARIIRPQLEAAAREKADASSRREEEAADLDEGP